jgi:dUTP pyrophosphatase
MRSSLLKPIAPILYSLSNIQTAAMSTSITESLQVKFLSETATMPTRGSPQAAGFDLSSAEKTVVPAGGRAVVKTDLSIACPAGTYARIAPRR